MTPFPVIVQDALKTLGHEVPEAHRRVVRCLEGRRVTLLVDDELVTIGVRHGAFEFGGDPGPIRCETDRRTILRLADAELELHDAIEEESLRLFGSVDDLLAFHDGLMAYLHGAVRSPSAPGQLASFRRQLEADATRNPQPLNDRRTQ